MPQPQHGKSDIDEFMGVSGDAAHTPDDINAFMSSSAASTSKAGPSTIAEINATLPAGATPVGQRTMTPAETEMTATAPTEIGPHGEVVPTGAHPLAATINPVTKQPFPGQRVPNTSAENWKLAREAAPWIAGATAGALSEGTMTWPVRAGVAAMLAGGTQAGVQFFDPERPDSAAARGLDIISKGTEVGGTEAAGELLKMGGGALLKRYFPNIHEAIEQGVTKFLHAVPSNDINTRGNYNVAMGDVQKIAREMLQTRSTLGIANPGEGVFSREAPGGIVSPEMRPTDLYTHIKDYMSRMYSDERKWQIMQAGGSQITVDPARAAKFDPDVYADAMRRIARIPDVEEGAHKIAARVAANPSAPITVEEADILEQAASTMLRKFRAGTGSRQAVDLGTQRNTALMQHADEMLNDALNYSLQQGGLPGINGYARRYAALARVMDNLEKMIPATERGKLGLGPAEIVSPSKIVRTLTTMAGQNPGREIEDAMRILYRAPDIPTPTGVPITPLPGRPGPITGPTGPTVIPHPPTTPPPAGPPLGMGTPPALPPAPGGGNTPSGAPGLAKRVTESAKDIGHHLLNPPIPEYARGFEAATHRVMGTPAGDVAAMLADRGIRAPKMPPAMQSEIEDILKELPQFGQREYRLIDKALKGDLTDTEAIATKLRKDLGLSEHSGLRYNRRATDLPAPPDLSEEF